MPTTRHRPLGGSSRSRRRLAAWPALLLLLAGCAAAEGHTSPGGVPGGHDVGSRPLVVSTVAPITSIVAGVVGDRAHVVGIVPEGSDSHTFEPPPQAAQVLERADVVFGNGLGLEDPTFALAGANARRGSEIVRIGDLTLPRSDYIYDFSFPERNGKPNPHLWTDPLYAVRYADVVRDVMVRRDPANASYYSTNRDAFVARATALSDAVRVDQETIPGGRRELLTYHDAYAYFARDYGWRVVGAVQPANFEDPQPKEIAALVDQVKEQEVPVVFGSEVFPSKVLEQIAAETGARYEDTLRDDDLPGRPGDAEHSWLGLMSYDFRTMISALGGTTTALDALDTAPVTVDTAVYAQ